MPGMGGWRRRFARRVLGVAAAGTAAGMMGAAPGPAPRELRVCADPNNLPFSNRRGEGLENRIAQGIVDFESGEGFHGLIAFDVDGDGVADASTYIGVGPEGDELPIEAQFRGPACRGITNLGIYFEQCVGA